MLKRLAIVTVFLAVTQALVPATGQTPDNTASAGGNIQQQGGNSETPPNPEPSFTNQNQATSAQRNAPKEGSQNQPNTVSVSKLPSVSISKDWADWGYWGFSGLLVVVGGFQVWLLWRTLGAIKKQADIQAVAMRQWVNVVPLRVHFPPNFMETGEATIQFEVVNRTDYLLTIIQSEVEIMPDIQTSRKFTVNCDVPLVPQKSAQDSSYTFYGIAHAPVEGWSDEGKIFIVGGAVTYRDAAGIRQTQEFQDLYRGYLDGRLERMKPSGLVPEEENSKSQSQKPN